MPQSNSGSTAPTLPAELQYRFQRNFKPLRDKHGPCAACQKLPPQGETFRVCTACKSVLYCSKECQRANWAKHKHNCQYYQKIPNTKPINFPNSCWPPSLSVMERESAFGHFYDLHLASFVAAAALLRRALLPRVIDFETEALVFIIAYRADNDGNPAKMFSLQRVRLVTKELLRLTEANPGPAPTRPRGVETQPNQGQSATLLITVFAEELGRDLHLPVPREISTAGRDPTDTDGMKALRSVQKLIDMGIVFVDEDNGCRRAGHMVKEGRTWQWQWLPDLDM